MTEHAELEEESRWIEPRMMQITGMKTKRIHVGNPKPSARTRTRELGALLAGGSRGHPLRFFRFYCQIRGHNPLSRLP
jgi:hypothetical protein